MSKTLRLYTLRSMTVLAALLCAESAFAKKKPKGKKAKARAKEVAEEAVSEVGDKAATASDAKKGKVSAMGFLGMDELKGKESESEPYKGFGLGAIAHYRLAVAPSVTLPLGGGLRTSSTSVSSEFAKAELSLTTLRIDLGAMFAATESFHIGGFLGYDYLLSGSAKITIAGFDDEEGVSKSFSVKSFSHTIFGIRGLFGVTNSVFLGGEYGFGSGSLMLAEAEEEGKFSSTQLCAIVGMVF